MKEIERYQKCPNCGKASLKPDINSAKYSYRRKKGTLFQASYTLYYIEYDCMQCSSSFSESYPEGIKI